VVVEQGTSAELAGLAAAVTAQGILCSKQQQQDWLTLAAVVAQMGTSAELAATAAPASSS
jgi:hypothetical protein